MIISLGFRWKIKLPGEQKPECYITSNGSSPWSWARTIWQPNFKIESGELTAGRGLQLELLLQVFWPQAEGPWPSNDPPPPILNWSKYWKVIQWSVAEDSISEGAIRVPTTWNTTRPLHGPLNTTGRSIYVPPGIKITLLPLDWQAWLNTFSKTYEDKTHKTVMSSDSSRYCMLFAEMLLWFSTKIMEELDYLAVVGFSVGDSTTIHHIKDHSCSFNICTASQEEN